MSLKKKKVGSYPNAMIIASLTAALFLIGFCGLLVMQSKKLISIIKQNIGNKKGAREGDANAMLRLAKMYLHGQGCARNAALAQEWLRKTRCVRCCVCGAVVVRVVCCGGCVGVLLWVVVRACGGEGLLGACARVGGTQHQQPPHTTYHKQTNPQTNPQKT